MINLKNIVDIIKNLQKTEMIVPVKQEMIGFKSVKWLNTYAKLTSAAKKKIFIEQINQ